MSGEKEEMSDILDEMREDIADGTVCMWADFGGEIARGYVNRIEAAFNRADNARPLLHDYSRATGANR